MAAEWRKAHFSFLKLKNFPQNTPKRLWSQIEQLQPLSEKHGYTPATLNSCSVTILWDMVTYVIWHDIYPYGYKYIKLIQFKRPFYATVSVAKCDQKTFALQILCPNLMLDSQYLFYHVYNILQNKNDLYDILKYFINMLTRHYVFQLFFYIIKTKI